MAIAALLLSVFLATPVTLAALIFFDVSILQALALYSGLGTTLALTAIALALLAERLRGDRASGDDRNRLQARA